MKKKFFAGLTVLLGVSLFVLGCDPVTGGGDGFTPTDNDAATGQMSATMADAIFGSDGWGEVTGGVEITGFSSETALTSYLSPLALVADPTAIFVINTIDNKHVVKIGAEAFKPKDGTDISNVVALIKLPATLAELGKDVFSGVTAEVVIPKEARDAIIAKALEDDVIEEGEKTSDAILKELTGSENVTIDNPNTPILGGSNTLVVLKADSIDDLKQHIETAKNSDNANKTVIIKLTEDFYTAANEAGKVIVVDPGETDNTKPYTIRGLGKDGTALTVGILLANDYVTLEDIYIKAERSADTSAISVWQNYLSAISIMRASDNIWANLFTGDALASKNVTVRNSKIEFSASSGMTAGIFVSSADAPADANTGWYAVPQNITITGNDIKVTNTSAAATQGIQIRRYGPTFEITNNTIESTNTNTGTTDAPANALFLNIPPGQDNGTPQISGNILKGSLFDFYINFHSHKDYVGDARLVADKFGTGDTVWMTANATDNDSFYKKLITTLISQSQSSGYGALFLYLGDGWSAESFATESYELTNGKVTAIDYWSSGITEGAYASGDNKLGGDPAKSVKKGIRARLIVNNDGTPGDSGNYHWARNGADDAKNNLPESTS